SACKVAEECPNTKVISIADREADLAELFTIISQAQQNEKYAHIIVRGCHNRALTDETENVEKEICQHDTNEEKNKIEDTKIQKKLTGKLKSAQSLGTISFTIPTTQNR